MPGDPATAAWLIAAVLVKASAYGAGLAAAGGVLFLRLFAASLEEGERRAVAKGVLGLAVLGIVATVLRPLITAGMLGGTAGSMVDWSLLGLVLRGAEGEAILWRIAGLVLVMAVAASSLLLRRVALAGGILAALSFALVGHAEAAGPHPWPQVLLGLHLLAIAYWVGALGPLLFLAGRAPAPRLGRIAARFGRIALFAVGLLVLAGGLLLGILSGWSLAVFDAAYGRFFVMKLVLVALLMGLAALNKLRLTPAILAGAEDAPARLARSIRFEIALVLLILLVTATLTTVTGPQA